MIEMGESVADGDKQPTQNLVYFADPMCSWCWGFSDVIHHVAEEFRDRVPMMMVMGGLHAGNTEYMLEADKKTIKEHWQHVSEMTGKPFDLSFFERTEFIYDTEPSCRAVVTAQRLQPLHALEFLQRLQQAFYEYNRDLTNVLVLQEEAVSFGFDAEEFSYVFNRESTLQMTKRGFALSRQAGVRGLPSLLANREDSSEFLLTGYQPWDKVRKLIENWLAGGVAGAE